MLDSRSLQHLLTLAASQCARINPCQITYTYPLRLVKPGSVKPQLALLHERDLLVDSSLYSAVNTRRTSLQDAFAYKCDDWLFALLQLAPVNPQVRIRQKKDQIYRTVVFISSRTFSKGVGSDAVNWVFELVSNSARLTIRGPASWPLIILLTARGQLLSSALRPLPPCKLARPLRRAFATQCPRSFVPRFQHSDPCTHCNTLFALPAIVIPPTHNPMFVPRTSKSTCSRLGLISPPSRISAPASHNTPLPHRA